ncbi:hypothetical protein Psfp_04160 [Pelotomaculum sp. FP]|uniref:TnsD family Tn7-like transposition protein n=1 Tax=Pelotomaculum sp. FP TaxID=261474 RepID=UPI001065BF30|nr:TnsD family Tn7-like transposition protein [Pelotomaculum sp. FP]TEB10488.1 hypothetical protein Psfp_04160 [Pelotomaculum sp. FP]
MAQTQLRGLIDSTIARYHYYSGNVSMRETLVQVFGDRNALPSIAVPCRLKYFAGQLENEIYTPEFWIRRHTILPYYLPFMDKRRKEQVVDAVNNNGGKRLFALIGMAAGGICRKSELYYCPQCAVEDMSWYGEAYFHRVHQLEGVFVCDKHGCSLKEYPVAKEHVSRIQFVRFDFKNIDLEELGNPENQHENEDEKHITLKLNDVAKAARYIINRDFTEFDNVKVHENITSWMSSKGYLTRKGHVRQRDFCHDLQNFYGLRLLELLECNIDTNKDYEWPSEAVRFPGKAIHPLRYILISLFLCGNAEGLFCSPNRQMTKSWNTTNSRGANTKGKYNLYDKEWEQRLVEAIKSVGSLRGIAREMSCDPKTVVKYADKLGIAHLLNSSMKIYVPKGKQGEADYSADADEIRQYVKENPGCTRNEVRKQLYLQYMRLYKHQRDLLYTILPEKVKQLPGGTQIVDWSVRDIETLEKAKTAYSRLLLMPEPVRISSSRLMKEMGYSSLRFYMDKLPLTKQYIENIAESVEEFQLRRVDFVCRKLYEEKGIFEKWEVMRVAGLRKTVSRRVIARIEENIEKGLAGKLNI